MGDVCIFLRGILMGFLGITILTFFVGSTALTIFYVTYELMRIGLFWIL